MSGWCPSEFRSTTSEILRPASVGDDALRTSNCDPYVFGGKWYDALVTGKGCTGREETPCV
jgi:hypothetical protein